MEESHEATVQELGVAGESSEQDSGLKVYEFTVDPEDKVLGVYLHYVLSALTEGDRQQKALAAVDTSIPKIAVLRREMAIQLLAGLRDAAGQMTHHAAVEAVADGLISQKQAAELAGVHQGTIGRWVKDRRKRSEA